MLIQARPEIGWASKCVVNDAGQAVVLREGGHSRNVWYVQQRVADRLNVEHLPNTHR